MNIVPRVNTPLDKPSAVSALRSALQSDGLATDGDTVALLASLIWLETGGGRSCQNFNVGNITASSSFSGNAWRPPWFELEQDASPRNAALHEQMLRGQAPSAFRAYDSQEAGMRDFVTRLRLDFPEVLRAAASGDPEAFRVALSKKYSRDYENPSATRSFASLMAQFGGSPKVPAAASAQSSPPASGSPSSSASLPVLRPGATGDAVALWALLVGLDAAPAAVRSVGMGSALERATMAWQRKRGLAPDGVVGPKTWGRMLEELDRHFSGAFA